MIEITTDAAPVNGTTLRYSVGGRLDGKPVVLLHSLFMWRGMMYPLLEDLATRGFRAYAYDHRGQGDSGGAQRKDLDLRTLTADAAAFIEHLKLEGAHVVGNSLGGMVALRLAAWYPALVGTVTTLGTSAEIEHRRPEFDPLIAHLTEHGMTGDLDTDQGPVPVVEAVAHIMFGDWTLGHNPELIGSWVNYFKELGPSIGDAAYGVVSRDSLVEELHGCKVPVLAVAGSQDHAYPQPISGKNIADATGGRHVTIERAGHSVALEQPADLIAHLIDHFAVTDA